VNRRGLLILAAVIGTFALSGGVALASPAPKTSLSDVEDEVMCPSCHEPLALAQSPQAISERAFIRTLIAQGMTKAQIKQSLVAQYGTSVLAQPPAHGFNLTVYVLPPALLLAGVVLLVVLLPRWRARSRAGRAASTASAGAAPNGPPRAPALTAEDARRLDEDLARYS
jgi:cytochrome c-type biogenesis protein CcmH/NrfF